MRKISIIILVALMQFVTHTNLFAQNQNKAQLLIRLDDMGVSHSVNVGFEKIFQSGLPVSASVLWTGPWITEAVKILKNYPNVSVGVHLCLNAEWENIKWGPVLGKEAVPSLVDSSGYFPQGGTWFYNEIFKLDEIEREFRAQIEKALASGLRIDYIDNHMGAGMMTDEQRAICEKLAKEYGLGISGYFNEARSGGIESYYRESNLEGFISDLKTFEEGNTYLVINHPGQDTEEMYAMTNRAKNEPGSILKQRNQVVETIISEEFSKAIKDLNIIMVNYNMLIASVGLDSMKKPEKK